MCIRLELEYPCLSTYMHTYMYIRMCTYMCVCSYTELLTTCRSCSLNCVVVVVVVVLFKSIIMIIYSAPGEGMPYKLCDLELTCFQKVTPKLKLWDKFTFQ